MHLKTLRAENFRRFSDLSIAIDNAPKLVALCGPNGSGKSSLLDALRVWHARFAQGGGGFQPNFAVKDSAGVENPNGPVEITFHEVGNVVMHSDLANKAVYSRTAYRHEAEFEVNQIRRTEPILADYSVLTRRSIDPDARVSANYQRIAAAAMADVFEVDGEDLRRSEIRDRLIGVVRDALNRVFPDLTLIGPGNPLDGGTFLFKKGTVKSFPYLNLSAGERATFDLILDLAIKLDVYDSTLIAIDEPELHLNSALQGPVLRELVRLVGADSQLWIATHSVGMLREARNLQAANPADVAFLDFGGHDFDGPVTLSPVEIDREFWQRTLQVAIGDLADLVAPSQVVICEGKPLPDRKGRGEFDARCYRTIFGRSHPDTQFVSVGSSNEVEGDRLKLGASIEVIAPKTELIRLIDRDDLNPQEIADLHADGVRVLGLRNLESYLLDDSVLTAYCNNQGQPAKAVEVLAAKATAMNEIVTNQQKPKDDLKNARGLIYTEMKKILALTGVGNSAEAFLRDELAPCLKPGMRIWEDLHQSVFGVSSSPTI